MEQYLRNVYTQSACVQSATVATDRVELQLLMNYWQGSFKTNSSRTFVAFKNIFITSV